VHDAALVRKSQRPRDILHDAKRLANAECTDATKSDIDGLAIDVWHHEIGKPIDFARFENRDDVRVLQPLDRQYLATGVTNAVAGKLMKTAGLRVLAPGRPRSVKRRSDTASTANIFAQLVLEGTVERVGNRLRVTARLSSTDDDVMQWADVFDRDVKDIFAVEDEIADAIVASVTPMAGQRKGSAG